MKLPWKKLEEEKEELKESIEQKEEEIERLEEMLESEQERRSNLAREKQEAEERINQLQDKIEGLKSDKKTEKTTPNLNFESISLDTFRDSLKKLRDINSNKKDLVTIYSPEKLSKHGDISDIRNSIPKKKLKPFLNEENLIILYTDSLGLFCFKSAAFFDEKFKVKDKFELEEILEFIKAEKTWVLVSRGESKIFSEKNGEFEQLEKISNRVNSQHGKGGFSQGRFERKREEQVQQHIENVEEEIQDFEKIYLLGEKSLCQDLPGKYLGGFDPNSSPVKNFYKPRRLKTSSLTP